MRTKTANITGKNVTTLLNKVIKSMVIDCNYDMCNEILSALDGLTIKFEDLRDAMKTQKIAALKEQLAVLEGEHNDKKKK